MNVDISKCKTVGKNDNKVDGRGLVTGKAKYVDDIHLKGMLIGKILTSPHAHAVIKNIDTSKAEKLAGVHAVLTYKNVPRVPHTTAGQGYPEPSPYDTYMFDKKVRYVGDRVAAVAAESKAIAEEAVKLIEVEYEVLPAILDPREAMKDGAPVIHDEEDCKVIIPIPFEPKKNLAAHVDMSVGDVEKGFTEADVVVEDTYGAHYGSHAAIEPHITVAYLDADNRIIIRTSTQVPFHVRRIVAQCLEIPVKKIRVIKPRIGGGFGGKQEILLEDVCAMLALRSRKPVKIEYTRKEDLVSSRTRHPQYVKIKAGAKKDGTITALQMDVISNTGAYGSHALTVVCNCGSKVLPLYNKTDNIKFNGDTVYTNLPVGGAYRGYGATQAAFAMECVIEDLADKLGIDPIEFRKKNHITEGEGSPVFQALGEGKEGVEQKIGSCGLDECIKQGLKEIDWYKKKEEYKKFNETSKSIKKGIGIACLMQGSSVPEIDMGAAFIKMNEDGSFNLNLGATDLGTGSDTVMAQIAAEILSVKSDDMIVYSSDTDLTPFDVGAYASSTTYLSGSAVIKTAEKVKEQIIEVAVKIAGGKKEDYILENKKAINVENDEEVDFSEIANTSLYESDQFQIAANASHITHASPPPFSAHFVDIEVDIDTGQVKLLKYVAAVDCGTAINPKMAEGQTEGAVMNGITYALTEEYIFNEKGTMQNPSFKHYKLFSTSDMPEIKSILVPTYEPTGPFGAKSVSELSINGALPAISNAIKNATGARIKTGPFKAEKILKALNKI